MSAISTGPVVTTPGQVSKVSTLADRSTTLEAELAAGASAPAAAVTPSPVTTPRPVDPPPLISTGETVLGETAAQRADDEGPGRVNRGQLRKRLNELANAVKHELRHLAKADDLDKDAEYELRTLARSFKSAVKGLFRDVKGDVSRDSSLDSEAVIAEVRSAFDSVRASAAAVLAPAAIDGGADDAAGADGVPVAGPGDGEIVADTPETPASGVTIVDAPAAGTAADPLASLDAIFEHYFASLSDLLERYHSARDDDVAAGATADASESAAAGEELELYARISASNDEADGNGFDSNA